MPENLQIQPIIRVKSPPRRNEGRKEIKMRYAYVEPELLVAAACQGQKFYDMVMEYRKTIPKTGWQIVEYGYDGRWGYCGICDTKEEARAWADELTREQQKKEGLERIERPSFWYEIEQTK